MSERIYFIGNEAVPMVKIGCAFDPIQRLLQLQRFSPLPLTIMATCDGGREVERNVQDCFADLHSHSEWFFLAPRLADAIAALAAGMPLKSVVDLNDRRGNVMGMAQRATRRTYLELIGRVAA